MADQELTKKIYKFGGPVILFICAPIYVWIMIAVYKADFSSGGAKKIIPEDVVNGLIFVLLLSAGVWMCRKGYGWFGGEK